MNFETYVICDRNAYKMVHTERLWRTHMPNLTINVPDGLKDEMDTLTEVNWSEVCRNAISRYIAQRKNPTPNIELELRNSRLIDLAYETGYPTLSIDLRIHNKMDSGIMVDRILANASFFERDGSHVRHIGAAHDLHRRIIGAHSVGGATIHIPFPKEKILELRDVFDSSFDCRVRCLVFVEDFSNAYNQEVKATIPIDLWNNVVKKAL